MGLRIVTDLFEAEGWDTIYLGANVPDDGILHAIREHHPDLLVISATMTFQANRLGHWLPYPTSNDGHQTPDTDNGRRTTDNGHRTRTTDDERRTTDTDDERAAHRIAEFRETTNPRRGVAE